MGAKFIMRFTIYAVGSNDVLTAEIKSAMDEILCQSMVLTPCPIEQLPNHTDGQLYVCNESLKKEVAALVPGAAVAILNLMPTSSFYLRIREIPVGSRIYIFNNRRPYCATLEDLCRQTGLTEYEYIPLVSEEMSAAEINAALDSARYVIGVWDVLEAELNGGKYNLREDTVVIGARRVASVVTTDSIVSQLNSLLLLDCENQLYQLRDSLQILSDTSMLHEHYAGVTRSLQNMQSALNGLDSSTAIAKSTLLVKAAINQLK